MLLPTNHFDSFRLIRGFPMAIVDPVERYCMSTCDHWRTVPALSRPSFLGDLFSAQPDRMDCDSFTGMRIATTQHGEDEASTPLLESHQTFKYFQESLTENTSGFALSVWFSPAPETGPADINKMQPILTLGSQTPPILPDDWYTPACPGYDFQILQLQHEILISYTDGDPERSCRYVQVPNVNLQDKGEEYVHHVVVTFDSAGTSIYFDGVGQILGAPNFIDPTLQPWAMEESTLQLFSTYASENSFGGAIHQVDIYISTFDGSQVKDLWHMGEHWRAPIPVAVLAQAQTSGNMIRQDAVTSPLTLQLGSGSNSTSNFFQLQVEVLSLPKHGRLVSTSSDSASIVGTGTRFPIGLGESSVFVDYELLSDDYFNQPRVNAQADILDLEPESFDFRILAYDPKNSELVATSTTVTQSVHVVHVNHPPARLDGPDEAILDIVDPITAVVTDITFEDDPGDFSMDRVRVDVWADHGNVALWSLWRFLADFDSCRNRSMSAWQCVKGPARSITFVALPNHVSLILDYLEYTSLSPGDADEIFVRVYDGAGGMCLDNAEHLEYQQSIAAGGDSNSMGNFIPTIRDECFQIQTSIGVPGYNITNPKKNDSTTESGGFLGFTSAPDLLLWGIAIALAACCGACCNWLSRQCPSCMARGAAVDVDNDDDGSAEPVEPEEQV